MDLVRALPFACTHECIDGALQSPFKMVLLRCNSHIARFFFSPLVELVSGIDEELSWAGDAIGLQENVMEAEAAPAAAAHPRQTIVHLPLHALQEASLSLEQDTGDLPRKTAHPGTLHLVLPSAAVKGQPGGGTQF